MTDEAKRLVEHLRKDEISQAMAFDASSLIVYLDAALECVKHERDAAIADMKDIADNYVVCMHCKKRDEESGACDRWHDQDGCWQWRGVKEKT